MYYSEENIREELIENLEDIKASQYPEDYVWGLGRDAVPVYYSDILKDWAEMPDEFTDSWQEFGFPSNEATIFDLMRIDLSNYYETRFMAIYNELTETI
jgi:hypothetical protein